MVDVTVMGAGIFGLSVAWCCLRRGAKVRVIDPNGVAAGASGGIVGALAPHVPENWNEKKAFQLESLLMAEGFWGDVARLSGHDPGYARLGRLQPISDASALDLARARATNAEGLWKARATWTVREVQGGWVPTSPSGWMVEDTLSARIHPRKSSIALARAIDTAGGEVTRDAPPEGRVVWATGVEGLRELSAEAGREVGNGVKGQAALLAHDARDLPQIFAGGVHIVPHADGTTAIGSTSEREYDDTTSTDARLETVIEAAIASCPALQDAPVLERWAGVRPRSKSRAPMLGEYPGRPRHFIANGGFKIGFGMAPKVGEAMADLVLEGRNKIPEAFTVQKSF